MEGTGDAGIAEDARNSLKTPWFKSSCNGISRRGTRILRAASGTWSSDVAGKTLLLSSSTR